MSVDIVTILQLVVGRWLRRSDHRPTT